MCVGVCAESCVQEILLKSQRRAYTSMRSETATSTGATAADDEAFAPLLSSRAFHVRTCS